MTVNFATEEMTTIAAAHGIYRPHRNGDILTYATELADYWTQVIRLTEAHQPDQP